MVPVAAVMAPDVVRVLATTRGPVMVSPVFATEPAETTPVRLDPSPKKYAAVALPVRFAFAAVMVPVAAVMAPDVVRVLATTRGPVMVSPAVFTNPVVFRIYGEDRSCSRGVSVVPATLRSRYTVVFSQSIVAMFVSQFPETSEPMAWLNRP